MKQKKTGISFVCVVLLMVFLCGCLSENDGLRVTIGENQILPQMSTLDGEMSINVYESVKGMNLLSRKDCLVDFEYSEVHTNSFFGVVETRGHMIVKGRVEPLQVGPVTEE